MWTGLYCISCIEWAGDQVVSHRLCFSLNAYETKDQIACTQFSVEVQWVISGYAHPSPLPALWYSYSKYTFLLYRGFSDKNSSLLYPADSCSDLKECLNKICTLPCCSSSESNLLPQCTSLLVGQALFTDQFPRYWYIN